MEVNQDIILHFPLPVGLHQQMERPIQLSQHSCPTGQYLRRIHQQVLRVGRMGITCPYQQLPHGGLLHLKHLRGLKHRMIHWEYLGPPVVHGERRPQHLMAFLQHHTPLGLNNPNNPQLNRVYPSIWLLDNPLPQGGLTLGAEEL